MATALSEIKEFFADQTLFITGGTGFLGKVVIEKLLRECPDLKKIYVLLRPKKDKTSEERFAEFFSYACFDVLKSQEPDALAKVALVIGDCQKPFLGVGEQDLDVLREETTCVIHAAANVKFDQSLKEASYNVRATRDLLELAKQMPKLRVFVHVSTAYANCIHSHVKEDFYEPPMKIEDLLAVVNAFGDDVLEAITPEILGQWPNTYVFTKSITEDLVKTVGKDLPVTIIRPAIVSSAVQEPIPGWIDNFYGVGGIVAGAALGVIRSLNVKLDSTAYIVPVDYVCNCALASAWWREKSGQTKIYNYVGDRTKKATWSEFMNRIEPVCWKAASDKVIWYYCFKLRENRTWHKICVFFLHTVTAYVADFVLICVGRPPLAVKNYQRLDKLLDLLSYFSTRQWSFDDDNVFELWDRMGDEDKRVFNFSMKEVDWDDWSHSSIFGARRFLLKDTLDTIPRGERKIRILFVAHYTLVAAFWYLVYKFVCFLLSFFF